MTTYTRAIALVTGANLLVPVVGLASAPILTQTLGVVGRGEASAAMAPNLLIVGAATLGLPSALTYLLATHPALTRRGLAWASLVVLALGCGLIGLVHATRDVLAGGDPELSKLIVLASWWALPTLLVALLRGAAYGRQMWSSIALERVTSSILRLSLLVGFALAGTLDVLTAVIVLVVAPVLGGLVYLRLLLRAPAPSVTHEPVAVGTLARGLLSFGAREWLGSIAIMLMARMSQLVVVPLAGAAELGLLMVAVTVSDVPYLVTQAVREVAFGVNSADSDDERMLQTSRIASLFAVAGSAAIGLTIPLWITALFGEGFGAALPAIYVLLLASCVAVPGLIVGAALDSTGLPGRRSLALGASLLANVGALLALTPILGALGAALATLISTMLATVVMIVMTGRARGTRARRWVVPERQDLVVLRQMAAAARARVQPSRVGARPGGEDP